MSLTRLRVDVVAASPESSLRPRYDDEVDFLVLETPIERLWPYGVDIDGNIVFDIDAGYVLANVDLHIPRRLWADAPSLEWPQRLRQGGLLIKEETVREKSLSIPIKVSSCRDETTTTVLVSIGEERHDLAVELSADCLALLSGDRRTGLMARLSAP